MTYDPRYQARFDEIRTALLRIAEENRQAMKYYKRRWDEDRGDEFAEWGSSDWYFEVVPDGTVIRQMEIYDNGTCLRYHADHIEDIYGGLAEKELDHSEFARFAITHEEFESAWSVRDGGDFA